MKNQIQENDYLSKYEIPGSYIGPTYEGYYVFMGKNRDSDAYTRSNFECALKQVEPLLKPKKYENEGVIRDSHWACGWIEYILIHSKNKKALEVAEKIAQDLDQYPLVDESHACDLENTEFIDYLIDEIKDDPDQAKLEKYLQEAGHTDGNRGSSIDEIDWNILEKIKNEEEAA